LSLTSAPFALRKARKSIIGPGAVAGPVPVLDARNTNASLDFSRNAVNSGV
jgi:hypothetical protein